MWSHTIGTRLDVRDYEDEALHESRETLGLWSLDWLERIEAKSSEKALRLRRKSTARAVHP